MRLIQLSAECFNLLSIRCFWSFSALHLLFLMSRSVPELGAEAASRHQRISCSADRRRPDLPGQSEPDRNIFVLRHVPSLNSRGDAGKDHKKMESCLTLQLLSVNVYTSRRPGYPHPNMNLIGDIWPSLWRTFSWMLVVFFYRIRIDSCSSAHPATVPSTYAAYSSACLNNCSRREYNLDVDL